jgi:hypothetical protein
LKAVVVDIDGTITHPNRELDCRAAEVLRGLNIPVCLASGNILCYVRTASKLIGVTGPMIGENGGVVLERYDGTPEYETRYLQECEKAYHLLSQFFTLEKLDAEYRKTEIALRRNFNTEQAEQILHNHSLENITLVDTGYAIHIKHRSVNKGTALIKIAHMLAITPQDFIAIGDSENDLEMLQRAGISIAVANAPPRLREIATYTTSKPYGAGCVEAITYLQKEGII